MDVTLTCNGQDFASGLLTYAVSYETGYGKTVTALDGTEYAGNLTSRPIVTFSMRPMTDAQTLACYNALTAASPISCAYTDPATNVTRTAFMRLATNPEFVFAVRSSDGARYYQGGEITLRGVGVLA